MFIFLITVHIIASMVLILVILLQSGRGGGLSESFGSGSTSTIFGTSASTFLQRATSACAIIFLITSLSLAVLSSHRSRSLMELQRIRQIPVPIQKEETPPKEPKEGIPFEEEKETPAEE